MKDTSFIQDAFLFCPMLETFVLNETLEQGVFAREREMSQMEDTKTFIFKRFITIEFDKKSCKQKQNASHHRILEGCER